jgi:hypothetical protein
MVGLARTYQQYWLEPHQRATTEDTEECNHRRHRRTLEKKRTQKNATTEGTGGHIRRGDHRRKRR